MFVQKTKLLHIVLNIKRDHEDYEELVLNLLRNGSTSHNLQYTLCRENEIFHWANPEELYKEITDDLEAIENKENHNVPEEEFETYHKISKFIDRVYIRSAFVFHLPEQAAFDFRILEMTQESGDIMCGRTERVYETVMLKLFDQIPKISEITYLFNRIGEIIIDVAIQHMVRDIIYS